MQSVFDVSFEINQLCLIDQNKLLCSIGSDKYILFDYISGRYDDSISDKISGKITRMYCKYEKVLLMIERGKREVLLDSNSEANGYKGFNIEIDRGNSLYLYSIGLYDIKDGKVSIIFESTKAILDIGWLSEDEFVVAFSGGKVKKYYINSSTIKY